MKVGMASSLILSLMLMSCGAYKSDQVSKLRESWNPRNAPGSIFAGRSYEANLSRLPLKAELSAYAEGELWSDDYWASMHGGISYRWNGLSAQGTLGADRIRYPLLDRNRIQGLSRGEMEALSPAEKYDILQGRYDFPITNYERQRTNVLLTSNIPSWLGLCHALMVAVFNYRNPEPVTMKNPDDIEVPFGSSDVKALLTHFLDVAKGSRTYFLGERCNANFAELRRNLSPDEYERAIRSSACRDTNAGSFHLVLTNQIGLLNKGFVGDLTRDYEVWNQSIIAYDSREILRTQGASLGSAPGTVEEVRIETTMSYINEIGPTWARQSIGNGRGVSQKVYDYVLELNSNGEIIGGNWISDQRPDFLYVQEIPAFVGSYKLLGEIYRKSIQY